MIAVIAGATGLVGSVLVQKLLSSPSIEQVISVSRKSLGISNQKLSEVLIDDLDNLAHAQESLRGDIYFCCLGTTIKKAGSQGAFRKVDFEAVVTFAKIAKFHASQAFVLVSAMGADKDSKFFYNKVKGETEDAVNSLQLRSVTIFRPGLLIGKREEFRFAEALFIKAYKPVSSLLPERVTKTLATDVSTLAAAMLREGLRAVAGFHIIPSKEI